jgi:hypothetical protein
MSRFARVTELNGTVQWINLHHVRHLVVKKPMQGHSTVTAVLIGNSWVERQVLVTETPEEILASVQG